MKKYLFAASFIILIIFGYFGWHRYGNLVKLFFIKPTTEIKIDDLSVADGFEISIFARDLPGVRVMRNDTFGNLWVSQPKMGQVSLLELKDGEVAGVSDIFTDLNNPHGLAFSPKNPFRLYIAEEDKIIAVPTYSEPDTVKVIDLPTGGSHTSRTIDFGPDGLLYVSVGSSCNVCIESDERRAAILRGNEDGSDLKVFAKGLRNTVFFTWQNGKMFGTDMGRDLLGDDLPPDEINMIQGGNYGWPICYGQNIHDENFDKNKYFRNPCMMPFEIGSYIDIPAHSAPLGLAFVPSDSAWPREYWGDLLVAYHGSWNRTNPTGYKVVRYDFNDNDEYTGRSFDFITGFLRDGEVFGRPVDILASLDGYALISDDYAGKIYKVAVK